MRATYPAHLCPLFEHPNNIQRGLQILLLFPPGLQCFPQHPVPQQHHVPVFSS